MKRDSHGGGIADNRNPLLARLKLLHVVNVGSVHRDAFGRALLVLNSSTLVANKAARSSGEFGNLTLAEVIDKLIKRVLRQL